jgi:UDP-3-O-[3-hydroxymyristoyl] glucosamine N-acyltransferase
MTWRRIKKLASYLPNVLIPRCLKNLALSVRTKSFVSPKADIYHASRVSIGRNCIIDACLIDANTGQKPGIELGDSCLIHRNTVLRAVNGSIHIGNNVSMQHFSAIYGLGNTFIGDNVLIASHCAIAAAQHNFDSKDIPIVDQGTRDMDTHIGSDVWIGAHVIIFSGITIGNGSIIGAGAVVNRDIPPYSVAVGAPARVIRKR